MTLDLVCGIVIGYALGQLMARNAQTKMLISAAREWRDNLLLRLDNGEEYHAGVYCSGDGPDDSDDFGDDDDDIPTEDIPAGGRFDKLPDEYWKNN